MLIDINSNLDLNHFASSTSKKSNPATPRNNNNSSSSNSNSEEEEEKVQTPNLFKKLPQSTLILMPPEEQESCTIQKPGRSWIPRLLETRRPVFWAMIPLHRARKKMAQGKIPTPKTRNISFLIKTQGVERKLHTAP